MTKNIFDILILKFWVNYQTCNNYEINIISINCNRNKVNKCGVWKNSIKNVFMLFVTFNNNYTFKMS